MNTKTFCSVPWGHVRILPTGDMLPCCKMKNVDAPHNNGKPYNINRVENFNDYWNDETLKNLRKDLHNGVKRESCKVCWQDEAAGKPSKRMYHNQNFAKYLNLKQLDTESWTSNNFPVSLEINFSNTCNLQCITCGPGSSSKIALERKNNEELFQKLIFFAPHNNFKGNKKQNKPAWKKLIDDCAPNLKLIDFKGGEPLLIKDVLDTIKRLDNRKDITLYLTTNGTITPTGQLFEQLTEFKEIWVFISVDATDQLSSYMRYGTDWEVVKSTIKTFQNLPTVRIAISHVLQFLSPIAFLEVFDFCKTNKLTLALLYAYTPEFLGFNSILPHHIEQFKESIKEKLKEFPDDKTLSIVLGFIDQYQFSPEQHEQCKMYLDTLHKIRENRLEAVDKMFM